MISVKYDGPIDIATGKSRRQKIWKNKALPWSELVNLFSKTHRTAETYAAYMAADRDRQDEIKDIGGFVGGYLNGGKRGNGYVAHRQLITLDIDKASFKLWEDFGLMYECSAVVYSTHKHSDKAPRLRLVIPLDREIEVAEYEPICRKIAASLDIEAFTDITTYEATRLMYWPSTSKDGAFFFDYQDGPWLSADGVLKQYKNWQDSSEYPQCSSEKEKIRHDIKKQEDPLEKPGIIGAFCRTYSITDAIEKYLEDVYLVTASAERFTYALGSTAGGLVVYDDKFAYSHHGSDPTGGKLCNAFDLVRLHKFGDLDEKASFEKMKEFAAKDKEVKKQLGIERLAAAREDFQEQAGGEPGDYIEAEEIDDLEWLKTLDVDRKGNYTSCIDNIYKVLKNDLKLKGKLTYDEFESRLIITGHLPWRKVTPGTKDFTTNDKDCLKHYIECYAVPFTHLDPAISMVKNDNAIHPVREYLRPLVWDGVERLDTLLIDYLGAPDTPYVRAATGKTFVAAVARVMDPGCKFDTMLTIIGKEGIGKSTIVQRMAGKWFSDCLGDIHDKSGMESLRGVWIMEVGELAGLRQAEQEAIKRFISSPQDIYRPAYGDALVRFARQNIFIATSNKLNFLQIGHEHRRYLPVMTYPENATKNIFAPGALDAEEVSQLWAEALTRWEGGESLDLSAAVKIEAAKVREAHTEIDERAGIVREFLGLKLPANWSEKLLPERIHYVRAGMRGDFSDDTPEGTEERQAVCAAEIYAELFEGKLGQMTSQNTKFIHDIMKKMKGWYEQGQARFDFYGRQKNYQKYPASQP